MQNNEAFINFLKSDRKQILHMDNRTKQSKEYRSIIKKMVYDAIVTAPKNAIVEGTQLMYHPEVMKGGDIRLLGTSKKDMLNRRTARAHAKYPDKPLDIVKEISLKLYKGMHPEYSNIKNLPNTKMVHTTPDMIFKDVEHMNLGRKTANYKVPESTPRIPTGKWIIDNITSGNISYGQAKDEVAEVLEEIRARNWAGIKDEASDVSIMYAAALQSNHGINLPALGGHASAEKGRQRMAVWQKIFADRGLDFHPKYLSGGSNYNRPEKVEAAIAKATLKDLGFKTK